MLDDLLKYVPENRRKAYLGMLHLLPHSAQTICIVGDAGGSAGYLLKKRGPTKAYGIVHRSPALRSARQLLDGVAVSSSRLTAIPIQSLDAVILTGMEQDPDLTMALLARIRHRLSPYCHIFVLYANPNHAVPGAPSGLDDLGARINTALTHLAYKRYQHWTLEGDPVVDSTDSLARLIEWVPQDYDPLAHARAFMAHHEVQSAYELLQNIPTDQISTPEFHIALLWERLQTIATWLETNTDIEPSSMLWAAQMSFYEITSALPNDPPAFEAMARCWHAVGDVDMAQRLLSTIRHVSRLERLEQQRIALPNATLSTRKIDDPSPWLSDRPFRVLFLMNPRPHYGIDVLYDGLCDCLGDEHVTDYPYKPWLHGEVPEDLKNYPCCFNRVGIPASFDAVLARLDQGQYDLILYGDVEGSLSRQEMSTIVSRAGKTPVALVDALDEFSNFRGHVARHLSFDNFTAYFKREMHRAIDYGPNSYPLPFSYDQRRALEGPLGERPNPFFWAGHRRFGIRRLYLETLEKNFGMDLNLSFTPDEYIQRIRETSLGLNCFGMGFDTVRYWELPAHGAMLLSERLPIEIPYDFVDGEDGVFFDDLPTLIEKLSYFTAHPDETAAIAQRGHARYWQYHTNIARAKQLLGWISSP